MEKTLFHLFPEEYEILIEDRSTETNARINSSKRLHRLLPEVIKIPENYIKLSCPDKLSVFTPNLLSFTWDDVQFPITFLALLNLKYWIYMYEKQFVFLKNMYNGEIFSFWPDIRQHDQEMPTPMIPMQQHGYKTTHFTYNIFYFFNELPKYSTEYEIWVAIDDLESNHKKFTLDIFMDNMRVLPPEDKQAVSCGSQGPPKLAN